LFPFSLLGKANQWFYKDKEAMNTWRKCSTAFLTKFFPVGRTNALRKRIINFQQIAIEPIPEAWERLQEYIQACPYHGMENWLVLQNFYNRLTPISKGHLDAVARGAFLSLTTDRAMALIEKMVENQSWGEDRTLVLEGTHTVKETGVLTTKIDRLLKKIDERATNINLGTVKTIDSQMTCEVCVTNGHSGHDCPETREEAYFINNGYHQLGGNNGWNNQSRPPFQGNSNSHSNSNSNQPSLRDLILRQMKTTENMHKKMMHNDRIFEKFNTKIEFISSFIRNQLSFNIMIETELA
jgi:hypothetical protein